MEHISLFTLAAESLMEVSDRKEKRYLTAMINIYVNMNINMIVCC
jgi:hypothetical protein